MLGQPWWIWLILGVIGFVALALTAARAWRRSIRLEFVEYLRAEAPDLVIVNVGEHEIKVKGPGESEGTLWLRRLYSEGTQVANEDAAGRRELFAKLLATIREGPELMRLDPVRDRERVLPRVVNETFLRQLQAEVGGAGLPALPLGVPGLSIVLVLDGKAAVSYLSADQLSALGLTTEEGLSLAKENLTRSFDAEIVRRAIRERTINVVKAGDSFDAARLLLLPGALQPGEAVAAVIPDRDTLVVTATPEDGNWNALRKLARTADGEPLWKEPLLITAAGVSSAPH